MADFAAMNAAFALREAAATTALGAALARALPRPTAAAGTVLHLHGDLGAGKTTSVRGLLQALGVTGKVRSPTYTLVETYLPAGLTCLHVDLYRLGSALEVEELGLREQAQPGSLFLIEWPEKGGQAVPQPDLELALAYAGAGRRAELRARTATGEAWLKNLELDSSLSTYLLNLT